MGHSERPPRGGGVAWPETVPAPLPRSALEERIAQALRPTPAEVEQLARARDALVARATEVAKARQLPLTRALVAGSAARETYLPAKQGGRLDLDLFLLFDPALPRERLASLGLDLAGAILTAPEKRYAEHPYLRGSFEGYAVDAVPGYAVERSDRPLTAVDRTPFHHAFLQPRLDDHRKDDVRLLKRFLNTLGVYGADARTEGFSGYLVELLIVRFGSFGGLLKDAATWRVPQRLCPPGPEPATMTDVALVLPDPVDPHRNVSSALSRRNLAIFLLAVREYGLRPREEFFLPPSIPPPGWDELVQRGNGRGGAALVLDFPVPDLVEDILVPQLRKCERALAGPLERWGFQVLGTASALAGGHAVVLVEVDRTSLSQVGPHDGPPAGSREVEKFLEKWAPGSDLKVQGPYVMADGKLCVDVRRERRDVVELLRHELPQMGFGRNLQDRVLKEGQVRYLREAPVSPELQQAAALLWDRGLPWMRWS